MKEILDKWLEDGKITQEEYDAAIAQDPSNADAWSAVNRQLAEARAARDAAEAREKEKDEIIASFATTPIDNNGANVDPLAAVVKYVNEKRGIK